MAPRASLACSAFCFHDDSNVLLARNLDAPFAGGYLLASPRGQSKRSFLPDSAQAARWRSAYGSLCFHTIGRGLPMGGINERGLVVEHLHMRGTVYPPARGHPQLLEFEWIQYLLDRSATLAEALANIDDVAIAEDRIGMHFILTDPTGASALVEFRDGARRVYRDDFQHHPLITNDWYDDSLRFLEGLKGFGGKAAEHRDSGESLDRFARIASRYPSLRPGLTRSALDRQAMRILDSVENATLLSVLYDPVAMTIRYKTRNAARLRSLSLSRFDFSPEAGEWMLDLHSPEHAIHPFSAQQNAQLLRESLGAHDEFLKLAPLASALETGGLEIPSP